jgi:hypothetical protein
MVCWELKEGKLCWEAKDDGRWGWKGRRGPKNMKLNPVKYEPSVADFKQESGVFWFPFWNDLSGGHSGWIRKRQGWATSWETIEVRKSSKPHVSTPWTKFLRGLWWQSDDAQRKTRTSSHTQRVTMTMITL